MPPALGRRLIAPLATESFQRLLEALREEGGRGRSVSVTGLPNPAKALNLLGVHHALSVPCALITRSDAEASALGDDLRSLGYAFGLADIAKIHVFPSLDADPYQGIAPHLSFVTRRMRALAALATGDCSILVASVEALFTPLEPAAEFANRCMLLGTGVEWREADEMTWFVNQGYERVDMVATPGEFSRRGGVIDLFMPTLQKGAETIATLRAISETTSIIAMTGGVPAVDGKILGAEPLNDLGLLYLIGKPFRMRELLQMVTECLA